MDELDTMKDFMKVWLLQNMFDGDTFEDVKTWELNISGIDLLEMVEEMVDDYSKLDAKTWKPKLSGIDLLEMVDDYSELQEGK